MAMVMPFSLLMIPSSRSRLSHPGLRLSQFVSPEFEPSAYPYKYFGPIFHVRFSLVRKCAGLRLQAEGITSTLAPPTCLAKSARGVIVATTFILSAEAFAVCNGMNIIKKRKMMYLFIDL
jgi:hypothetical protein